MEKMEESVEEREKVEEKEDIENIKDIQDEKNKRLEDLNMKVEDLNMRIEDADVRLRDFEAFNIKDTIEKIKQLKSENIENFYLFIESESGSRTVNIRLIEAQDQAEAIRKISNIEVIKLIYEDEKEEEENNKNGSSFLSIFDYINSKILTGEFSLFKLSSLRTKYSSLYIDPGNQEAYGLSQTTRNKCCTDLNQE